MPPLAEGVPTSKPAPEKAADFLLRQVRAHPHEVTILALGPLTNLGLAIRLDDEFAGLAKELVFMGGSFRPAPAANEFSLEYLYTPRLEFNFRWDPEAAKIVLHAPWAELTQVPVDPTTRTLFTPELKQRATASSTAVARYVRQYGETLPMWDELAAAVWLDRSLATRSETMAVDVDTDSGAGYGNTLSWPSGKGPGAGERDATVVFDVDVSGLEQFVVDSFNRAEAYK